MNKIAPQSYKSRRDREFLRVVDEVGDTAVMNVMKGPGALSIFSFIMVLLVGIASTVPSYAAPPPDEKAAEIGAKSDRYSQVVDRAIDALIQGDANTFRAFLSPGTIKREQRGSGAVDTIINDRFIPFFKDFKKFSANVNTIATRDIDGNRGLALARSFYTQSGSERFFVIYVLDEKGTLTIGNLLLDTTMADITRGR